MRFRLRTLFFLFLLAAILLSLSVKFVRWAHSRPGEDVTGKEVMGFVDEIANIKDQLGKDSLQELRIWRLYGWETANLWTAKMPREAIEILKKSLQLKRTTESQMPPEFWDFPSDISETPRWWKPKPTDSGEYYKTPSFNPQGSTVPDGSDGAIMYDPEESRVWVWSHFDF